MFNYKRIYYSVSLLASYISHRDMISFLSGALRRTGRKFRYSEGYTPRLWISCGPARPVGVAGDNEFFDIALLPDDDGEGLADELNKRLTAGITVVRADSFDNKPVLFYKREAEIDYLIEPAEGVYVDLKALTCGKTEHSKESRAGTHMISADLRKDKAVVIKTRFDEKGAVHIIRLLKEVFKDQGDIAQWVSITRDIHSVRI